MMLYYKSQQQLVNTIKMMMPSTWPESKCSARSLESLESYKYQGAISIMKRLIIQESIVLIVHKALNYANSLQQSTATFL
jgi:hypothetical protein